jgi:ketosteroid isomerase-like protein
MSQDNVEIVSGWIDSVNREGYEEAMRFLDPEIEWTTTGAYLEAGTYHGHEGVGQYLRKALAAWEAPQLEPETVIDGDDRVVVPLRVTTRSRQTGTPAALTITMLAELQGGVIVRIRNYSNRADALKAAGLTASP